MSLSCERDRPGDRAWKEETDEMTLRCGISGDRSLEAKDVYSIIAKETALFKFCS